MAKILKYWGEFLSIKGVVWRIELLENTTETNIIPEEIFFPPAPITIEWESVGKLDVIQRSTATLTLESDTDRRFINLYRVAVGAIILNVYRNGKFYWSGTLDPELYEEPYWQVDHYDVTLTFSDFAVLDRLKCNLKGIQSAYKIVYDACDLAGFTSFGHLSRKLITSLPSKETPIMLDEIYASTENFYDEQGEPMTLAEAIESVLQPFPVRLVQKEGKVWLTEMGALYPTTPQKVVWAACDSTLGVDDTYNNVTVNYSPYADAEIIDGSLDDDTTASDDQNGILVSVDGHNDGNKWLSPEGFRIFIGKNGGGGLTLGNGAKFFRIEPEYSGSKDAGVAMTVQTFNLTANNYENVRGLQNASSMFHNGIVFSAPIITTAKKFITYSDKFRLKIKLDLLFDVRFNPFEQAGENNEEELWNTLKNWCNFGYIPIMLNLKSEAGDVLYHYTNSATMLSDGYSDTGKWESGAGKFGDCYLCYYDKGNRRSSSGFGGWQTNKQIIGYFQEDLPSNFAVNDGQYLPMPPGMGWLELQIGSGVYQFDFNRKEENIYPYVRWLLYKNPTVEIVKANDVDYQPEDVEIKAWINKDAKEDLAIETTFGVSPDLVPSARGQMFDRNGRQITQLKRAGITDTPERLLIGTAYSQYASRNNTLSGTVDILDTYKIYSDGATPGKYILTSEIQNLGEDTSEIRMVELKPDNFEGIEYE